MHGIAPKLLLLDEISQWPVTSLDAAISALKTSRGKIPESKGLWIGTRPGSEDHPFAKRLKGIGVGFALVFAAGEADDPFDVCYLAQGESVIRSHARPGEDDQEAKLKTRSSIRLSWLRFALCD